MEQAWLQDPLHYADVLKQAAVKKANTIAGDAEGNEANRFHGECREVLDQRRSSLKLTLAAVSQKDIVNTFPEDMFSHAQRCSQLLLEEVVLQNPDRFGDAIKQAAANKRKKNQCSWKEGQQTGYHMTMTRMLSH